MNVIYSGLLWISLIQSCDCLQCYSCNDVISNDTYACASPLEKPSTEIKTCQETKYCSKDIFENEGDVFYIRGCSFGSIEKDECKNMPMVGTRRRFTHTRCTCSTDLCNKTKAFRFDDRLYIVFIFMFLI